jgi:tRNA-dihydrouridine synthase A
VLDHTSCIAPMLDWTDRHYRYLMRLITPHTLLYTEMITTGAILFGDKERHLAFSEEESPVALQLGGSKPDDLAACARLAEEFGYAEVNLNVGCPSDRVQNGQFGACLMKSPALVAECVLAMREACSLPITVKTRIGVDELDSYEFLTDFVGQSQQAGCETFIIHARKAWLKGLSPKQNRDVPPLRYDVVFQLKKDFPDLCIVLNGGIKTMDSIQEHLKQLDGVMIGREAYQNPYFFAEIEEALFKAKTETRQHIVKQYVQYMDAQLERGVRMTALTRPLLCLFKFLPNGKLWRREISERNHKEKTTDYLLQLLLSQSNS